MGIEPKGAEAECAVCDMPLRYAAEQLSAGLNPWKDFRGQSGIQVDSRGAYHHHRPKVER